MLQAAPTDEARLMLQVLVMTGVRSGEAKGLQVKDVDARRGRLMIRRDVDPMGRVDETKTRNHRDVPVSGQLLSALQAVSIGKKAGDWLLPDERGKVWTTAKWRGVWKVIRQALNDDQLDTHELRHTAASLAIAAGADVKTVQRMLGHASAAVTLDTYGHLWDRQLDTIPDAMDEYMARERRAGLRAV